MRLRVVLDVTAPRDATTEARLRHIARCTCGTWTWLHRVGDPTRCTHIPNTEEKPA